MQNKKHTSWLKIPAVQTLLASLLCIVAGVLIGYIALLIINTSGATEAILTVLKNFWTYSRPKTQLKYLGSTLVKTAPLLMCALSVLFAYKVGLFNIGAAGQYVAGAGASLYCALALQLPWWVCLLAAIVCGALLGAISGALKAYCNVNEVISCIMLNWISLYTVNTLLSQVKDPTSPYTLNLKRTNAAAALPSLGLEKLFNNNANVTIAIPLAILCAIAIWVLLAKTRLGYELRATGLNRHAAKYCGMRGKFNIILAMAIAGALAGAGAAMLYLTGFEEWSCTQSSVPAMGFNGIAAAFLGGLSPIGTIFASFFIQHITNGGAYVDKTMYCSQISDFISSVIIYLCGFVLFIRRFMNSRIAKVNEEKLLPKDDAPIKTKGRILGGICVALAIFEIIYTIMLVLSLNTSIVRLSIGNMDSAFIMLYVLLVIAWATLVIVGFLTRKRQLFLIAGITVTIVALISITHTVAPIGRAALTFIAYARMKIPAKSAKGGDKQ